MPPCRAWNANRLVRRSRARKRQQLLGAKRLQQIVIGARIQASHAIVLRDPRG